MSTASGDVDFGLVVWITGLSGAGKSTIARLVQQRLRQEGVMTLLLDGDEMREAMQDPHYGYDRESRLKGALRYARFARLVSKQGIPVLVSTISLFHDVHDWNRSHLPHYLEVVVDASESERQARDPKGHYRKHAQGDNPQMAGLDLMPEFPKAPHLVVHTDQGAEPEESAEEVFRLILTYLRGA